MSRRRVVITGLGIVSPLGYELEGFWEALTAGRSGISNIEKLTHDGLKVRIAGEIKDWVPTEHNIDKRYAGRIDLFAQYAIGAAHLAMADSGIDMGSESDPGRLGCILGSGVGGLTTIEEQCTKVVNKGPQRVSPFLVPKMMVNSISGEISIIFGLQGQNYSVVSACASSTHAIALAARAIRYDDCDMVLTGGSEAAVTLLGMGGFASMRALSTRNDDPTAASRPFDRDRDGFVMGEGAGILVIEELERAKARGAKIYAEVLGSGYNADAYHITSPNLEGLGAAQAIKICLKDSGLNPEDVDYINAHGTSTPINDPTETKAIKLAFGDHAQKLAISSTKSMVGHLLGGSGGVEGVAAALTILKGEVHPTANLENPDPECDLDYVPGAARKMDVRAVISNSFGFGGHNVSLCFGKFDG